MRKECKRNFISLWKHSFWILFISSLNIIELKNIGESDVHLRAVESSWSQINEFDLLTAVSGWVLLDEPFATHATGIFNNFLKVFTIVLKSGPY